MFKTRPVRSLEHNYMYVQWFDFAVDNSVLFLSGIFWQICPPPHPPPQEAGYAALLFLRSQNLTQKWRQLGVNYMRVKVIRFPYYFDSNWVDSQLMPPYSIPNQSNSEIRVIFTRNGVDSQLTPFPVKFDSAEIRVRCYTKGMGMCANSIKFSRATTVKAQFLAFI